ncbi:MAG: class I SAM-dependent methyltransferase [FCB group bacterium]|nr:class I SAM-dependent methyltransferase [FCB group bacterium]
MSESVNPPVICPLCGSGDAEERFACCDALVSGVWFTICDCRECGLTFTGNPPNEKEIGAYYQSEDYVSHAVAPRGLWGHAYALARRWSVGRKRKFVEKKTGLRGGLILDYGCGGGFFLEEMARHDWQVAGVEPAERARKIAQDVLPGPVVAPDEFLQGPNQNPDIITLWHVLEHLYHPEEILIRLRDCLKPGGWLIVAVPNAGSWEARTYGPDWAAWDVPRHVMHYTFTRLQTLLENTGFETQTVKSLPLDPFYISLLSERQMETNGSILRGGWRGIQSFIRGTIHVEKCSSLVWVARCIAD